MNITIDEITNKLEQLKRKRPLTSGEVARLNGDFTVEFTYNSNAIEGNTLTLRETDLVLRGLTIDRKPLKEHLAVVGHKEAFDAYHVHGDLSGMENLLATYLNERLDMYLSILD